MEAEGDLEGRLAWVDQVAASPPVVHPDAPNGAVWNTELSCYELMARHVRPGARTLETGAGMSTVLFAAWACQHVAVVPFQNEVDAVVGYCDAHCIPRDSLHFDVRPSEVALPELSSVAALDLVFIDGCHGFPMPIIDWFYGAQLLRRDGILVFDDVQLPQVRSLIDSFIGRDDRWQGVAVTGKWMAFRRMSEGPLAEGELNQRFFPEPARTPWRRTKDAVPLSVRTTLWRAVHGSS